MLLTFSFRDVVSHHAMSTHIHVCVCVKRLFLLEYVCLKLGEKQILNFENHFENKIVITCLDVLGIMT